MGAKDKGANPIGSASLGLCLPDGRALLLFPLAVSLGRGTIGFGLTTLV